MRRLAPVLVLMLTATLARAQDVSFETQTIAQRGNAIRGLLEELPESSAERRIRIVSALGELRAADAVDALVDDLARLHLRRASPLRDPASPDYPLATALATALARIGRPGLKRFLDVLATWPDYALGITWAFVSVHGEEGMLVLKERARTEENPERQRRLQAAAWFARLRDPDLEPEVSRRRTR